MTAKGTAGFIAVRASSVLLLPFTVWFIWSIAAHAGDSREAVIAWLSSPLTASLFGAFLALSAFHMRLGMNEVIEDYIYSGLKGVLMTINTLVCLLVAGFGVYAAYMLGFQG